MYLKHNQQSSFNGTPHGGKLRRGTSIDAAKVGRRESGKCALSLYVSTDSKLVPDCSLLQINDTLRINRGTARTSHLCSTMMISITENPRGGMKAGDDIQLIATRHGLGIACSARRICSLSRGLCLLLKTTQRRTALQKELGRKTKVVTGVRV